MPLSPRRSARYTSIIVSTQRIVRQLSLIALLFAAILNPTPHVRRAQSLAPYTVAFHLDSPPAASLAKHYQLVAIRQHAVSARVHFEHVAFTIERGRPPLRDAATPFRELDTKLASASPDRLTRFQLPPPALQA